MGESGNCLASPMRMTWGLIGDEQGGIRAGWGCVDQMFTLKQIGEKAIEKRSRVYMGFIGRRHMIGLIGKPFGKF